MGGEAVEEGGGVPQGVGVAGGVEKSGQAQGCGGEAGGIAGLDSVEGEQEGRGDLRGLFRLEVALRVCGRRHDLIQEAMSVVVPVEVLGGGEFFVDHVGGGHAEAERVVSQGVGELRGVVVEEVAHVLGAEALVQVGGGLGGGVDVDVDADTAVASQGGVPAARGGQHATAAGLAGGPQWLDAVRVGDVVQDDEPSAVCVAQPVQQQAGVRFQILTAGAGQFQGGGCLRVKGGHLLHLGGSHPQDQVHAIFDGVSGVGSGKLGLSDSAPTGQHAWLFLRQYDRPVVRPRRVDPVPQCAAGLERRRQLRDRHRHHRLCHGVFVSPRVRLRGGDFFQRHSGAGMAVPGDQVGEAGEAERFVDGCGLQAATAHRPVVLNRHPDQPAPAEDRRP